MDFPPLPINLFNKYLLYDYYVGVKNILNKIQQVFPTGWKVIKGKRTTQIEWSQGHQQFEEFGTASAKILGQEKVWCVGKIEKT